jgi:hypothetical protein
MAGERLEHLRFTPREAARPTGHVIVKSLDQAQDLDCVGAYRLAERSRRAIVVKRGEGLTLEMRPGGK